MANGMLPVLAGTKWKCKCGNPACRTTCEVVGHSAIIDCGGEDKDMVFGVPLVVAKVSGLHVTGFKNELILYFQDVFGAQYEQIEDAS